MKLVGTVYSLQSLNDIAQQVCPYGGSVKVVDAKQIKILAQGVQLTLEQSGIADPLTEALLFGEIDLPLSVVDLWFDTLKGTLVGAQLDLHADEARLVRRFSC